MRLSPALLSPAQQFLAGLSGRPPIVLLFGWLGGADKHVQKYARLWREMNAEPLVQRPSILQTALPALADGAALAVAARAADHFERRCQADGQAPPVLVQCMSGAGFIAYGTLLHLTSLLDAHGHPTSATGGGSSSSSNSGSRRHAHPLLRDARARQALAAMHPVLAATRGIVIDSAPPLFTPGIWSRGLITAMFSVEAHGLEERYPMALRAARALTERYFQAHNVARRMVEVRHAWQYAAPLCPQLYLYSCGDPLVPHQHVELFMDQQAARGVELHGHCWEDTGHCDHLRRHPFQYRQLLLSFGEHVLLGDENTAESWI